MEDSRLLQIAQKVFVLTQQKKVKWEAFGNKVNYFTTKIDDQELAIFSTGIRYVFQISDSNKNVLGSLSENGFLTTSRYSSFGADVTGLNTIGSLPNIGLSAALPNFGIPTSYNSLQSLFELVKSSIVDVDKSLDELLKKLNNM
jgi:hypothetical protein